MADRTKKTSMKYIVANQSQKEVTINENLNLLDMLVQASAKSILNAPPAHPDEGDTYIVGTAPTGLWTGKAQYMAGYFAGAWLLVAPRNGWRVWMDEGKSMRYQDGNWVDEKKADIPAALPPGGKKGQVLVKLSDNDYECAWQDAQTGGAVVPSPAPGSSNPPSATPVAESIMDDMALYKPNTEYRIGDIVYRKETKLRRWYICTYIEGGKPVGKSGATPPAWKDTPGNETLDNDLTWETYEGGAAITVSTADHAKTAGKLKAARTIELTGGVQGSAAFDGSKNVSIAVTVQK
ncbi:DUF2793 domain-containing protein [uncultured Selenomonas sp.]|uniref:DUF2793 domain-containing protein n=1 Tax=uncultured Selenomonas sp. TaxID=159275 RepID=UPI0028D33CF3|nr:DUF2793 domain-containing protein [uncultured Selenomonas sp.]